MTWLKSRRLRYLMAVTAILFALFTVLRAVFYFGFSDLGNEGPISLAEALRAWGIGLRFDLRLAILVTLPLALLAWLPGFNLGRSRYARYLARAYLGLAVVGLMLFYIVDFGHYAYLGDRLNVTALRFLEDTAISAVMVWQSYPVVWLVLAWFGSAALVSWLAIKVERRYLARKPVRIPLWQKPLAVVVVFLAIVHGILGRVSDINYSNPIPLRWDEAFAAGNESLGNFALNPVIYFYSTLIVPAEPFDQEAVATFYPDMASYLGLPGADPAKLDFARVVAPQPHALKPERPPNVVFIMLESLGASRVGAYGTPHDPTPNLDQIARDGWMFKHFYVPVTGTAKTIWATFTGIPDVAPTETASRNPFISHQKMVLNELKDYRKLYMIGGNASWANIAAMLRQSIDGLTLYQEGDWEAPDVDVWGISDLELLRESHEILAQLPDDQPFFAFIQTAGNHRPFTIPDDNGDFQVRDVPAEALAEAGFRSAAQYNAVRLLDYNIGEYMKLARQSDYFDNTIFVFFGDHNNRITTLPFMPPAMEQLGLESNHVPHLIYAPRYLAPRVIEESVSLLDVMPTVAGLLGLEYRNTTLGRDFQIPAPEQDRASFVVLQEGPEPVYGMVTKDFLVRMNHDGSNATLHDLASATPREDVSAKHPPVFETLSRLARGVYESARFLFYENVDDSQSAP